MAVKLQTKGDLNFQSSCTWLIIWGSAQTAFWVKYNQEGLLYKKNYKDIIHCYQYPDDLRCDSLFKSDGVLEGFSIST